MFFKQWAAICLSHITITLFSDIELPKLPNGCPADQNVFSGPLESPVPASWVDPVATDNSGQAVTLRSDLQKGASLGLGVHTVEITAHDQEGNQASCRFVVTVSGTSSFTCIGRGCIGCLDNIT